jgi:hypothetical protein
MSELGWLLQLFQILDFGRRIHRSIWKLANRLARDSQPSKSESLVFLFLTLVLTVCAAGFGGIGLVARVGGAPFPLKMTCLILAAPVSFTAYCGIMFSIARLHRASLRQVEAPDLHCPLHPNPLSRIFHPFAGPRMFVPSRTPAFFAPPCGVRERHRLPGGPFFPGKGWGSRNQNQQDREQLFHLQSQPLAARTQPILDNHYELGRVRQLEFSFIPGPRSV